MFFKVVFFVFSLAIGITNGFSCYACGFSSSETDRSCLTITNTTRHVVCPFKYCTILRQDLLDPPGTTASFTRGCEQTPDHLNHEVEDSTFRTYYRACTHDLCNIGNGIELIAGGNLSPTPEYAGENLLVPGTRNKALGLQTSLFSLIACIFVIYSLQ